MDHSRFEYSPITERKPWRLPDDARVALWVIPNIEHFQFDQPGIPLSPAHAGLKPDVMNYGWRDYGARVGVWRLMDLLKKHEIPATAALNSEAAEQYPQIIAAGNDLGWEWMAHGQSNSSLITGLEETEERRIIRDTLDVIEKLTGKPSRGWLGPALTETLNTPDILAEEGIGYLADWTNDDQPYPMRVRSGTLTSIPYSLEINDISAFMNFGQSAEQFSAMIKDQFDVLYEEGKNTPRVMAICLHPFLIGHAFRSRWLDDAFQHIKSHQEVWYATGSEIIDSYLANDTA